MRIAIFLTSPAGGGAERAMIAVANYIAAHGADVDMVLGHRDGPYLNDIDGKVRIVGLGVRRYRQMFAPMLPLLTKNTKQLFHKVRRQARLKNR